MRGTPTKQLVIPKALREKVMELGHDSKLSGHRGIKRTRDKINVYFYWPGRESDVRRYCPSCGICQRTVHKGRGGAPAPLGKMPLIDTPFKRIRLI